MIHDALDGTSGRRVFRIAVPPGQPIHVIAHTAEAAVAWLQARVHDPLPELAVSDVGDADRTEIALWRDESRL